MNNAFQYTSPDLSEKLAALGVRKKSDYMYKYIPGSKKYQLLPAGKCNPGNANLIHAYSIAELGLMIPWGYFQTPAILKQPGGIWMYVALDKRIYNYSLEVEARGFFLLDLLSNNEISIWDVNNPQMLNRPQTKIKN